MNWLNMPARLTLGGLLALLMMFATAPVVSAHATLLRADPASGSSYTSSPDAIDLWFSEPVELQYSRVIVLRTDGSRVLAGDVTTIDGDRTGLRLPLREELSDDGFTVVWSTISATDAHVSEGYFSFSVGEAGLPSAALEARLAREANEATVPFAVDATVRWLSLLGQAAILGALVFLALILLPVTRTVRAEPYRVLLWSAYAIVVVGHLGAAVVQVCNATRSRSLDVLGDPLVTLLTDSRYGAVWLARSALLLALALLLWVLLRRERLPSPTGTARFHWFSALFYSGLVLLTTSIGSHAAARSGSASLAVANDWLHLLGTSVWIGGLLALVVSVPVLRASETGSLAVVLKRFSTLALGAVGVLVVTGIIAARAQVVDWDGIVATRYGMWFTLKLALVVATVGFGAYHLLVSRPALESGTGGRFERSLTAEAALAVLVVVATGLLTASIPARDLLRRGDDVFGMTQLVNDASVTLRFSPGQLGTNEFSLVVSPIDTDTFGAIERVVLTIKSESDTAGAEATRMELRQSGPNDPYTFRGTGSNVDAAGDWSVAATIERAASPALSVPFEITATDDGFAPAGRPVLANDAGVSTATIALAAGWLLAGISLAVAGWRMRPRQRPLSWGLFALALVTASLGSALLLVSASGSV